STRTRQRGIASRAARREGNGPERRPRHRPVPRPVTDLPVRSAQENCGLPGTAEVKMTRTEWREWIQALLMPVAVAAAGYWVAQSNATREVDARMIEIAAQVLAGPV